MTLQAVRTSPPVSRRQRLAGPLLTGTGVLATTVALHYRDPHQYGSWGLCPLYALTGIYCPGCGGLRAVNDLTHGNVGAAASSNLLFVALVPLILVFFARWLQSTWTGVRRPVNPVLQKNAIVVLTALTVVFTIARNLPFGHWLAP